MKLAVVLIGVLVARTVRADDDATKCTGKHDAKACYAAGQQADAAHDEAAGAHFYELACNGGHLPGCTELAVDYMNGTGVAKELRARRAARKAGVRRQGGRGLHRPRRAVRERRRRAGRCASREQVATDRGCTGGSGRGCAYLAEAYDKGTGVTVDLARAKKLYALACTRNFLDGCSSLGTIYARKGADRDAAKATVFYTKACDGGLSRGCLALALAAHKGDGIEHDEARANVLLQKACDLRGVAACAMLGYRYFGGDHVPADPTRAVELFKRECRRR